MPRDALRRPKSPGIMTPGLKTQDSGLKTPRPRPLPLSLAGLLLLAPVAHAGPRAEGMAPLSAPQGALPRLTQDLELAELAVPALTFTEGELFTTVGAARGEDAPDYHGTAFWYQGLMGVVFAKGMFDGGISLFDVSDPTDPVLVGRGDHPFQREGHSTGFMETDEGLMAVVPASNGINVWDLSDVTGPKVRRNVPLPGVIPSDYDFGTWWVAVQAPYAYVAAAYNGLFIVDLSNLRRPRIVDQIKPGDGFRCGSVYTVGNLLVQSSSEGDRTRIYDISDPESPQLLKAFEQLKSSYATHFNGGYLYAASDSGGLETIDLHDVFNPVTLSQIPESGGGAYTMVQDEFAFVGNSNAAYKIDVSDPFNPVSVGSAGFDVEIDSDADFVSPMGNMMVISDDHVLTQYNIGSHIIPHQMDPDTRPPEVNFISPREGAASVYPTSRVGFTFTDQIMVESVTPESVILRPVAGGPAVTGYYSVQQEIVNFAPATPLAEETEYEVVLPAGGILDWSGNALAETHRHTFTTGRLVINPPIPSAGPDLATQPGATVVLDASRTDGGEGAVRYSWDFGDGSAATALSLDPVVSHAYAAPGHYTAIVTALDDRQQSASDEAQVTVAPRAMNPRPTHATTIAHHAALDRVFVVNPDADSIGVVDAARLRRLAVIPVGRHPRTLAVAADATVYVVNQDDATVTVVDGDALARVKTYPLPAATRPFGIVVSPEGDRLFVSLEGTGEALALDAATGQLLWRTDLSGPARGIALIGDTLYVSRFVSPETHGEVYALSKATGALLTTHTLAEDPGPDSDIGGRGVPNYLSQLIPSPDGGRLLVPGFKQNTSRGSVRDGQDLTFESTNRAMMGALDLDAGGEDMGWRLDFDNRDYISAVGLSPLGDYAFVAVQGSQDVLAVDIFSGQGLGVIEHAGQAPQGLVVTPDLKLFVQNFMGRDVSIFDVSTLSGPEGLAPLGRVRTVIQEPLDGQTLLGKRIFYNASSTQLSRDSYISCAGCHMDGGDDGRVWDRNGSGEGFRRTIPLRGRAGTLHGPVHWSANFDEIQDFEHDIRGPFEGTGLLDQGLWTAGTTSQTLGDPKAGLSVDLDALNAYLTSLAEADPSPYRSASGALTASAQRGKLLFEDPAVGCATCHAGPHFTDSTVTADPADFTLHDVGTLKGTSGQRLGGPLLGLDTPTLKGTWSQNAYLHDGSAPTLRAVLTTENPEDLHGQTSQLSEGALGDLIAYVSQIDARSGGPALVAGWPEAGGRFEGLSEVRLTLSSWPDPSTLSGGISVTRGGQAIAGTWAVEGVTARFSPSQLAVPGTYTVSVTTDLLSVDGDPAVPSSYSFEIGNFALVTGLKISASTAESYSLQDNLRPGALVYGDRDTRMLRLPRAYEGLSYLRTANADRRSERFGLIELTLSRAALIYVAFPRTMERLPGWAADFEDTGERLLTTEIGADPMHIYRGTFAPGKVYLGGPKVDGGTATNDMYVVFFEEI